MRNKIIIALFVVIVLLVGYSVYASLTIKKNSNMYNQEKQELYDKRDSLRLVIEDLNNEIEDLESKLVDIRTQGAVQDSTLEEQRKELEKRKDEVKHYKYLLNKKLNETINRINSADSATIDSLRTKYFK